MRITVTDPYGGDDMAYDSDSERYILGLAYAKKEFSNDFADDGVLEKRLKKNSRIVYDYVFSHSSSGNRRYIKFLLNRTEEGRKMMLEALSAQMGADMATGYNDLLDQPRIDLSNGTVIDQAAMVESQISIATRNVLEASSGYLGLNVVCSWAYPYPVQLYLRSLGA